MGKITVYGGKPLCGAVTACGSKNAALPIIFATLITRGKCELRNVPDIGDVRVALELIEAFGALVERQGSTLLIDTASLSYRIPDIAAVCRIRASTYLLGACLSRFGTAQIQPFGGCNFSTRPIDMHLLAASAFGARRIGNTLVTGGLRPANLVYDKVSVGATVNAIFLAVSAPGTSRITPYAKEPHVLSLIGYLRSAGAKIYESGNTLTIVGTPLHGGSCEIVGDMIEAGTYLAASLITGGEVTVSGISSDHLASFAAPFAASGVAVRKTESAMTLSGLPTTQVSVTAEPYPGFPTDLQPIAAPIIALGAGGCITDTVFPERFGYLDALRAFGIESYVSCGAAQIKKSAVTAASVTAPDLRGGAACILAALCAKGKSVIENSEIIFRGYCDIANKLIALGADVIID